MRPPFLRERIVLLGMDEGHQAGNLLIGIRSKRGMPFVGASIAHDGADLVSIYIRSHQLGPGEIRPGLSAARVAAMTKRAILPEKCASLDQLWDQIGRVRCGLGGGNGERPRATGAANRTLQRKVERRKFISAVSVCIAIGLWTRMRGRAALRHAQHPLDRFKIHLADVGIAPGLLGVAEGRIEHAPFAVHLVPRDREIMIRSVNARVVA